MSLIFIVISQIVLTSSSCPYDSWESGCNNPKFMVDSKVCAPGCPTLYYFYQQHFDVGYFNYCSKPTGSDAILFTLILSKVQDLTLTYVSDLNDSNKKFVNPGGVPYISGTQNSPLPTLDRGFYFATTSSMTSPLPTLDRGFYFATTSSMTSNQSYTPGLYFILNLIIKPLGSGDILNIQINSTQYVRIWADSSGYYKISALIFNSNGAQIAVSGASSAKYSLSWHSLSVSLSQLSCDLGSITFYIDGNEAGTTSLSSSEISFPIETYTWTFGSTRGDNSFRGFIYWIQARADSNINYGIMTIAIDCADNQYWDGSACQNCEAGCPTWPWCIRGGCSFCISSDCSSCYGYSLSMCTDHISNSQISKISRIVCSTGCQTCTGGGYHECKSCQTGYYFLQIQCLTECPTGYTPDSSTNKCVFSGTTAYSFQFPKIILLDTISGVDVGSSNTNSYPNYDPNDPYPAYNRGYYFNSNSYLKTIYMHSPSSSIGAWIKTITGGFVLIKYVSTTTQWFVQILPSGEPKFYFLLSNSSTTLSVTGASSVLDYWFYVSFECIINTDGTTTVNSYIDTANQVTSSTTTPLFLLDSLSGNLYLGHYSSGFTGFAWKVKLAVDTAIWTQWYSTTGCSGTCIKCAEDYVCLDDCLINQYYDGSTCKDCMSTCTKGCKNSDSCRLCETKECDTCTAFSGTGSCLTCITNAVDDGAGGCTCDTNAFWVSSSQSCEFCDIFCSTCLKTAFFECSACSGSYNLIGTVCFDGCPYGFGTSPCSPVSTPVIDISFDGNFQGAYGIFTTGTDPALFQFFNTPETADPVPAYKRGLFFDGNMYLAPSFTPQLSHSFSFGTWIYVINNGDWLQKIPDRLNYASTGSFSIRLENSARGLLPVTLSLASPLNTWKYLSVTSIYYLGSSTLTIYINGSPVSSLLISNRLFRDTSTSSLIIGKSTTSGFVGFIRSFQMWNTPISDFSSFINAVCGSGSACLWSCDLSHFYDGANYISCNSCSLGCVRANTCNICYDLLCSVCTGFDSGKCTQCVANASGAPGLCACNTGFVASTDGFSCVQCSTGCQVCTGPGYYQCTSCKNGYYFLNIQCLSECPWGYTQNSVTHTCDFVSLTYSMSFSNEILLGTFSGNSIGASSTNSYPIYDANDPYPSYLRGYYFTIKTHMHTSFMLAPSFSISLCLKPTSGGIVMLKYISGSKWIIQISASGQPSLYLRLSDPLLFLVVIGSSSVLNNWTFMSFDCIINADGTTTITSYIDGANQVSASTPTPLYYVDSQSGIFQVGDASAAFTGFLWNIKVYSQNGHALDDYQTVGCSGSCTKCPADLSCPDNCPLSQYYDGSGCTDCIASCNKGCRNSETCRLCKTKECATCTEFSGTNSCLTCITNAVADGTGGCTCDTNAFWVASSQTCEICDALCSTCISATYFECSTCLGSYQLVGTVCLNGCPYGYSNPCSSVSTPVINQSFDIDFYGSYGVFTAGASSTSFQFFNNPESIDPIPAYKRGLYFDGTMYLLSNTNILLSHSFSIGAWIYVITNGDWLEKQNQYLVLYSTGDIRAKMENPTQTTSVQTLSSGTTLNNWNYLSFTFEYTSDLTNIRIYLNGASILSSPISNYIFRDLSTTSLMIGKSSSSGFVGFINSFRLWNTPISDFSSSINSACGTGQGYTCLWSCDLSHYYGGASYTACNSCSKGCVRASTCNICDDLLCSVCSGFGSSKCTQCVTNASGAPGQCICNAGYKTSSDGFSCEACYIGCSQCTSLASYDCLACFSGYNFYAATGECLSACPSEYFASPGTNICVKCDNSCKSCTSASYLDCLTCADDYYMVSGICVSNCPSGYSRTVSGCILVQEKIFDLDLNTLNGVIYDSASEIPVITGSTSQFYPDYEDDDPIPAYLRGFWFNGQSSVLRLPDYLNYTSPKLVMGKNFTISIWLNIKASFSSLLSKHNVSDNYSALYSITLTSDKPTISLLINSSPFFYMCQASLNHYEWSHVVFTLETAQNGYNKLSCYINGASDSSVMTGYGSFLDVSFFTTMTIGAQISSSSVYNFYQGFIYTIQIFNTVKSISALATTSCTEPCNVCPISQKCIPNCKINLYWSGPAYNKCYNCNIKCKKSCRDWRSTCSLCSNLLCDICTDYSDSGCSACKEYAINPDSCICDLNYVLDTSSNSTCILLEAGGFRGSDGKFYSCPKYCTYCQSLTECTACVENANLINSLCYCSLGYNGTANCILVPFSAKLSVLSDNSLYLIFSDSLAKNLTIDDFTIKIKKLGKISYKFEQVNSACYYITLKISEEISKGTLAMLKFTNLTEVRSVSNGVLNSSEISVFLNSYDPAPNSPAIAAVSSQAAVVAQTGIAVAAVLSVINSNPSSLWSMMNSLQILSYLTLSGIPLSSKMSAFLNSLNSFNLFPNAFTYIIDEDEGKTPYSKAKDFGFDTDLILITAGNDFTLILVSLLVFPIVLFFSRCSFRWIGKKFMKSVKAYHFAFYIRFWIQCYLELGAASSIGLITFGFNNNTQVANFIMCSAIYSFHAITPPVYFWFSYKNKNRIQSQEKTFTKLFSSFFYEFRTDRGPLATQYYFVFFARRLIYIINLVFLRDYPQTEVTINIILSVITILHLIFFWPFKDSILQISNLLTEGGIFIIMSATTVYLFNMDPKIMSIIEDGIVAIVIAAMGIQILASIAIFARTLYEIIKYKLTEAGIIKNQQQILEENYKRKKLI
ncbi:unnamed protein product [Blepharisma stoltei]|uniref:TNFR-Cys domain-containing protein n=1 Tax=Blepharisma stoltei TaxID=1481888 RepID=A0AAU9K5U0_9CILI|nr:unnamed protein product [Blepharisma stoltei]